MNSFRLSRYTFTKVINRDLINSDATFIELFKKLDTEATKYLIEQGKSSRSITAALSKMHGDWYEWLLCYISDYIQINEKTFYLAIKLPNASILESITLYEPSVQEAFNNLKLRTSEYNVELITSNPDFIIVNRNGIPDGNIETELEVASVDWHEQRYKNLINRCKYSDIKAYLGVKYTLRPDRRLQLCHEGSHIKAVHTYLQSQLQEINYNDLLFYAAASKVGKADRIGLHTVATHSIANINSIPQAAVDKIYEVKTIEEAKNMFRKILM
jgi:hypothetical protein